MNELLTFRTSSLFSRLCLRARVMPRKFPLLLAIGATVAAITLSACGYRAGEAQFETDAITHGVRQSLLTDWPNLGNEACASLKAGETPASWATSASSYPPDPIPIQQGEAIIYWAVKDVCPD